ncbi:aspartyl/asparaginyl beta-hydroxylase domain-containing protein [Sphingomonas chungangi]|uniref:aspartyl/asparaginyl beta-hydroxylase domain-containing protein n=1 Tax=Sphingomonas chungangi TaxID=2683589 RepID=UPI001FE6555E|nr:aspartyl/asparaginyl beta-hydroxylase domain-containing protein [Sphingomonas chungangi]
MLERLVAMMPADNTHWLKLAGMCRAMGDSEAAMRAVRGALAAAPLDFTALLLHASLLDRAGDPEADMAFDRALAQRPSGALPPPMAAMAQHAESRRQAYLDRRGVRLLQATASVEARLDPDERRRLARFRSNVLRQTRPYHSEPTHFHYPGLVEREFHDRQDFPWLAALEAATEAIREEFQAVATAERAQLVPYIQYADHEPLQQWRALNHNRDWTAIHLIQNGEVIDANARHCPRTVNLLRTLPQPHIAGCSPNAMFSLLAPKVTIPPHTGVANTRLVCHLPLIVPDGCWFRVGAETREWHVGQAFVFDDTIEHEACNPTDQLRVVLIVDVWHPGLRSGERHAVQSVMEAEVIGATRGL